MVPKNRQQADEKGVLVGQDWRFFQQKKGLRGHATGTNANENRLNFVE